MAAETDNGKTTTFNIRVPASLAEEIDDTWEERGFTSRSEFVRHALRIALEPLSDLVRLSDETLEAIRESGEQIERGETCTLEDELSSV